MESDKILEGFKKVEVTHLVRYIRFIGDGDSSVYPILLQYGTVASLKWSALSMQMLPSITGKLAANNASYKGRLTEKTRKRLTSAARCAIKMRSKKQDKIKGLALLKKDLMALTIVSDIALIVAQISIKLLEVHMLTVVVWRMKKVQLKAQVTTTYMVSLFGETCKQWIHLGDGVCRTRKLIHLGDGGVSYKKVNLGTLVICY